ncbi:hypothetical protein N5P37_003491 [Trichoderma harzianum]|nr:hypothetical protein N5P37_003491 [Trichoderma harzianum]
MYLANQKTITHALHLQRYTKSPHFKVLRCYRTYGANLTFSLGLWLNGQTTHHNDADFEPSRLVARVLEGTHKTNATNCDGSQGASTTRRHLCPMDTNAAGFDFRERILQHLFRAAGSPLTQFGSTCSNTRDRGAAAGFHHLKALPNLQQGYTSPGPPSIAIAWDKAAKSRVYRCMR